MREYNENTDYNLNESFNLQFDKISFNRIKSTKVVNKKTTLNNLEVSFNRNFNTSVGFAHNGGKRKGSFAIYLEPWHADIFDFIDLRKNHGKEEMRARDLFLALWVPDLFMKRVEEDGNWTLFSPDEAPGLSDVYDSPSEKKFTQLYESYEEKGLGRETIKARKLMDSILTAQIETGTPYMLYKDAANYKSNQQNLGTIKSSNLCITGSQRVVSNKGYLTAKELYDLDEELILFNGETSVKSSKMKLRGKDEDVYRVTLENGMTLDMTSYHKVPVDVGEDNYQIKEYKDLVIGDKVPVQTKKGIFGTVNESPKFTYDEVIPDEMWKCSEESIWEFIVKLPTYSKTTRDNEHELHKLHFSGLFTDNLKYLQDLQLLLVNLGIESQIINYPRLKLEINETDSLKRFYIKQLEVLGHSFLGEAKNYDDNEKYVLQSSWPIVKLEYIGVDDVYCPTIDNEEHIFVAQGMKTVNCSEIIQYSSPTEQAVCNLASIALPKFIDNGEFNHQKLFDSMYQIVRNLNNVIDVNYYPTKETEYSNLKHRPMGVGVQGLADVFCLFGLPFESEEANKLQVEIFETMYYAGLTSSNDLAKEFGSYESYEGTPTSKGLLQYDLWYKTESDLSVRWDWLGLKWKIKEYGLRNSLIITVMPTASCTTVDNEIVTENGIKSYSQIMEENNVDWKKIEETDEQQWIQFKNPIMVNTRHGYKEVNNIFYNGHVETLSIEMEDGVIFNCSHNHKFLINKHGLQIWELAIYLNDKDEIVVNESSPLKIKSITYGEIKPTWDIEVPDGHEYLMSNGCVSHNTAQILGNNEAIEPFTSNLYARRTLGGEFVVINKHLVNDLLKIGLWNDEIKNKIIMENGSVQNIPDIPTHLKEIYKTVWEMSQKTLLTMSANRGIFIDQSQSFNIFMSDPTKSKLLAAHMHGWKSGLKTGMYYLRTKSAVDAIKGLGIDTSKTSISDEIKIVEPKIEKPVDSPFECEACGS